MSDLADLLKELEQVAKDTNLKEVKKNPARTVMNQLFVKFDHFYLKKI